VYAGANTLLDALCRRRSAAGLASLSVSLGAIADAGFVARTAGLADALAERGMVAAASHEALDAISRLLRTRRAHVGLFRYDWSRYGGSSALVAGLLDERGGGARADAEDGVAVDARAHFAAADGADRRRLLHERLTWHVSRILGVAGDGVDPDRSLVEMGLDSLMTVDLQHFIESEFGAEVPVMSILQGWSMAQLATEVERRLGGARGAIQ
jgi:acyl carrier protein